MTREVAKNVLKSLDYYLQNRFEDYGERNHDAMMVAIKSLEQEPKWIPVSERLPKEETDVLVCNVNGDIEISSGSYSTEMKNEFIWYTSSWRFEKVIAWMPLPEPYKANEEMMKNDKRTIYSA